MPLILQENFKKHTLNLIDLLRQKTGEIDCAHSWRLNRCQTTGLWPCPAFKMTNRFIWWRMPRLRSPWAEREISLPGGDLEKRPNHVACCCKAVDNWFC